MSRVTSRVICMYKIIYVYFFFMKMIFAYFNKDIFDLDLKKKTQMKCDFSLDTFITASGLPFQVSG